MRRSLSALVAALVLAPASLLAGIADTPLPPGTSHLFSIAGVVNISGYGTFVTCTSTTADPQTVTLEVFGANGLAAGTASMVLPGHGSGRLGTRPSASFIFAPTDDTGSGLITFGAARIVSTVKNKLVCTAAVGDAVNDPPTSMGSLNVVAKLKQKAAN